MKKNQINSNTKLVKKIAKELGFSSCGISKARFLKEELLLLNNIKVVA